MPFLILFIIAVLTAADQWIKAAVVEHLQPIGSYTLIPGLLEFRYTENTGAAFGMLGGFSWLFIVATILISAALLVFLFRYPHHNWISYASCALIIAGGIGNVIDRFTLQYVVDFIHVLFFPYIFNFADCCVVVGAVLFAIWYCFMKDKQEKKTKNHPHTKESENKTEVEAHGEN